MGSRMDLHTKLVSIFTHAYFQPPENTILSYPCVIYDVSPPNVIRADNKAYLTTNRYSLLIICNDPDDLLSFIEITLKSFQMCNCDDTYKADNLYHAVFTLYY